ncbi:unnamed protein product, partial [Urochloa humidicola]
HPNRRRASSPSDSLSNPKPPPPPHPAPRVLPPSPRPWCVAAADLRQHTTMIMVVVTGSPRCILFLPLLAVRPAGRSCHLFVLAARPKSPRREMDWREWPAAVFRLAHPARPASTSPPPPSRLPPRSVEPYPAARLDPMAPSAAHEVPDLMASTAAAVPQEAEMAAWGVSPRCGQIQLAAGN